MFEPSLLSAALAEAAGSTVDTIFLASISMGFRKEPCIL